MPIVGMNVPNDFWARQRSALTNALITSPRLKELFPGDEIRLDRLPYTGDYLVKAYNFNAAYPWRHIAKFGMLPMPGCRAICILHHAEIEREFRGKGVGTELLRIRLAVAKELGYKAVICTVRDSNLTEIKLLAANGVNRLTGYIAEKGHSVSVRWLNL